MAQEDQFRSYLNTQNKTRRLRSASNLVFLATVLILFAGSAIGLIPELEKSKQFLSEEAVALAERNEAQQAVMRLRQHASLLEADPEFLEQEFRNAEPRAGKPGETLILIPEEKQEAYRRLAEPVALPEKTAP